MTILSEGLKGGDLEDLVLSRISIDEYESKLDDDSIVVAFSVADKEPAQDLNRFIQKGAVSILDTDVSPAPNEDGYFLVFVELLRDQEFTAKLLNILESLQGLTNVDQWTMDVYDVEGSHEVSEERVVQLVRLTSHEDHGGDGVQEDLEEFFQASDLDSMLVEGHRVVIEARGVLVELHLVDLGSQDAVWENNAVMGSATRLDEGALSNCRRIQRMLGDLWLAEQRGDHYLLVSHALREDCALFRF